MENSLRSANGESQCDNPDEALDRVLDIADAITSGIYSEFALIDLAVTIRELDTHLRAGGDLPARWSK